MSNVFTFGFDFRLFWKIAEFSVFHFPNMLVKATIVTFIKIFAQLDPLDKMLFKQSSSLFVNIEVIKNQSANFFNQCMIRASFYGYFSISYLQEKFRFLFYICVSIVSLALRLACRIFCEIICWSFNIVFNVILKSIDCVFFGTVWLSILSKWWWFLKGFTNAGTEVFFWFYIFDVENLEETRLGNAVRSVSHF